MEAETALGIAARLPKLSADVPPLLCELHAHTTWSDGALTLRRLVELYGRSGFDVFAVTDHVVRDAEPWCAGAHALAARDYPAYRRRRPLEVCNRQEFFGWIAHERLPVVANGDFHRPEHLPTWKTVIPAEKSEAAVVDYLRSSRPVFLARFDAAPSAVERAA